MVIILHKFCRKESKSTHKKMGGIEKKHRLLQLSFTWAFPSVGLSVPIFCSSLPKGFPRQSLTQPLCPAATQPIAAPVSAKFLKPLQFVEFVKFMVPTQNSPTQNSEPNNKKNK